MADTLVDTNPSSQTDLRAFAGPYWLNRDVAETVFPFTDSTLRHNRTTDQGTNWTGTELAGGTILSAAAWFDQETPEDTGTLLHVAWMDSDPSTVFYRTLDVNDGSLGTIMTVDAGVTTGTDPTAVRISITKTVGGNLLVAFSTQTEIECYRSVDTGSNWTDRADPFETATEEDWLMLFPADTADNQDATGIFWDRSANQLSIKMYDDSGNSWTETTISGTMTAEQNYKNMDGAIRHSDNHLLLAAHSDADSAGDDLLTWDLTVDSIASPTIGSKTNIFTDESESEQVALIINQQNDDVYAAYMSGTAWLSNVLPVFKISTNGMDSWGATQSYGETIDDNRRVHGGRTISPSGGRIQWAFYEDDNVDVWVNEVNDLEIGSEVPAPAVGTLIRDVLYGGILPFPR